MCMLPKNAPFASLSSVEVQYWTSFCFSGDENKVQYFEMVSGFASFIGEDILIWFFPRLSLRSELASMYLEAVLVSAFGSTLEIFMKIANPKIIAATAAPAAIGIIFSWIFYNLGLYR